MTDIVAFVQGIRVACGYLICVSYEYKCAAKITPFSVY